MLTLYVGDQGCGKSTLLHRHVYESRDDVRAFLILDRNDATSWDGPLFRHPDEVRRLPAIPRFVRFRRCSGLAVVRLAIDLGDCVVVDEEVHRIFQERSWPRAGASVGEDRHPLYDLVHEGRHMENKAGEECWVAAWGATHRIAALPDDARALVSRVYLGRHKAYAEAEVVHREGWLRGVATSPREVRDVLEKRQPGEFSVYP